VSTSKTDQVAKALLETLISPNVSDSNWEAANVVDVIADVANAIWKIARTNDPKSVGSIELHAQAVERAGESIASAIWDLSSAIRSLARRDDGTAHV
jgi:hypothetical protein